jgi:hypothetical protein
MVSPYPWRSQLIATGSKQTSDSWAEANAMRYGISVKCKKKDVSMKKASKYKIKTSPAVSG